MPLGPGSLAVALDGTATGTADLRARTAIGGTLAGTYAIPLFPHCGLATPLLNLTIPGGGNTISLALGGATLG